MPMLEIFLELGLLTFVFVTLAFILALLKRDNSIVDVMWGLMFMMTSLVSYFVYGSGEPIQILITVLVCLWGCRLALHILIRNWGKGEDFRYAAWRENWGKWIVVRGFVQIFLLQGFLHLLIVSPVVFVNALGGELSLLARVGLAIWAIGFFFESVGDAQLSAFIKTKKKGEIMTKGLWKYTRHPNYFGEVTMWWGVFLIAVETSWWALLSPLLISYLILYVSGIPMLEAKYKGNKAWEDYAKKTSAFFPMPPKA